MHAIKSRLPNPFRRDGVAFPADRWLLVAEPTEAQLTDTALIVVEEVESLGDPRLARYPVGNPDALSPAHVEETSDVEAGVAQVPVTIKKK